MPARQEAPDAVDTELPRPVIELRSSSRRVLGFGKPLDWSLRPYSGIVPASGLRNLAPSLYIPKIALEYGMGKMLFAPVPTQFNALVCTKGDAMAKRIELRSERYHTNVWLWRGAYADGIVIGKNSVYFASTAGCSNLTLRGGGSELGVAHAGRDSLFDRNHLFEGVPPRRHESVVMALVEAMQKRGNAPRELAAEILFPIDPRHFDHPWDHTLYGEKNKILTEMLVNKWGPECILGYGNPTERKLGMISLEAVMRSQLISLGVLPERIKVFPAPPRELWHDTREGNGSSLERNGVFIQNF